MNKTLSAQGGPARGGKIVSIIITLIAIGATGWFLVAKKSQNDTNLTQKNVEVGNENQQQEKQISDSQEPNVESQKSVEQKEGGLEVLNVEDIDTSNWKTYRNEEFGFEVKYPEEWEYRDIKKDDKVWSMGLGKHGKYYEIEGGGDNAVSISISPAIQQNNNTVPHILRVWQDSYDITINKVKINDMVGYYYSGFGEGIIFPNILNHKDVKISSIIMTTPKIKHNIQPVLQNIINSFKSIK